MPKKYVMYCCENSAALAADNISDPELASAFDIVRLPCSGRIESTLILKTLERSYDGVIVLGCPEDNCKFVIGNKLAANRVRFVRDILTGASLDGSLVDMDYVSSVDTHKVVRIMRRMIERDRATIPAEIKE